MTAAHKVGAVFAHVLLAAQSVLVVSVGWALLSSLLLWEAAPDDKSLEPWIEVLRSFHVKMAAAFLTAGVVACMLHLSWGLQKKPPAAWAQGTTGLRMLLTTMLAVLTIWVVASSAPWLTLWRDGLAFLDSLGVWRALERGDDPLGFSALLLGGVLLVPGLEMATAGSFLIASASVFLLLWANNHRPTRILMQCVLVQGTFLFATFQAIESFDRLGQAGIQLLDEAPGVESTSIQVWMRQKQEQATLGAHQLSWCFIGYLLLVPLSAVAAAQTPPVEDVRPLDAYNAQDEGLPRQPLEPDLHAVIHRPLVPPPGEALVENSLDPDLQHPSYVVRSTAPAFFSLIPGPHRYEISGAAYGADEQVLFRTARSADEIRIAKRDGSNVVTIRPDNSLLPAVFAVFAASGEPLGTFKRDGFLRPAWLLLDNRGARRGAATLVDLGIGRAKYEIALQGETVATLTWRLHRLVRPEVIVDFLPNPSGLDHRLGLALAVVLESKARFWSQLHNS